MVCPGCGSSSEATPICPGCGLELPVDERGPAVQPVEPKVTWVDEPVDPAAARCSRHPELLASGTCVRCGRFICVTCAPASLTRTDAECDDCTTRARTADAPKRLARYRFELVFSQAVMGALVVLFTVTIYLSTRSPATLGLLVMGGPVALGLGASAALFGVTRRQVFAWVGVAVEALVILPLFFFGPSLCTVVLVAVPIYSVVRVLQVGELEALIGKS